MEHLTSLSFKPALLALLLFCTFSTTFGQSLQEAIALSEQGRYQEAQQQLEQMREREPERAEIWQALGFNYSWQGRQAEAIRSFEQALVREPGNIQSLAGLGYALAWNKDYAKASATFQQLLVHHPFHQEGEKGLAYVALWSGKYSEAASLFEALTAKAPALVEFPIARALALLNLQRIQEARETLSQAQASFPDHPEIAALLLTARTAPAQWELDIWGGYSQLQGEEAQGGIRGIQGTWRFSPRWTVFAKYDNSLSLDVAQFANRGNVGYAYSGGLIKNWKGMQSTLEAGQRFLAQDQGQFYLHASQQFFLPGNFGARLGLFLVPGDQAHTEWMTYVAGRVPIGGGVALEPGVFFTQPPLQGPAETRFQLTGHYRSSAGYEFRLSGLYGRQAGEGGPASPSLTAWTANAVLPFTSWFWGQVVVWNEQSFARERLTSIAVGAKFRIQR